MLIKSELLVVRFWKRDKFELITSTSPVADELEFRVATLPLPNFGVISLIHQVGTTKKGISLGSE